MILTRASTGFTVATVRAVILPVKIFPITSRRLVAESVSVNVSTSSLKRVSRLVSRLMLHELLRIMVLGGKVKAPADAAIKDNTRVRCLTVMVYDFGR